MLNDEERMAMLNAMAMQGGCASPYAYTAGFAAGIAYAQTQQAAMIAQARADAARIDYIASNARCDPHIDGTATWWPTSFNHRLLGPTLRDAIDAAMTKEPPHA